MSKVQVSRETREVCKRDGFATLSTPTERLTTLKQMDSGPLCFLHFLMASSIRTPMLTQGRLERTETNQMHFKWEVTNARKPT